MKNIRHIYTRTAYLGIASVGLFVFAFLTFSILTPGFDMWNDYISLLGAQGQPFATLWNLVGFISVGVMFSAFGWAFGRAANDHWVGVCLTVSGIGFAMAAIPADFINSDTPLTKAHFVSICLALASWCIGLARMGHSGVGDNVVRMSANIAGTLAVLPMIGTAVDLLTAPVSHRLVLGVVFGWVIFASVRLLIRTNPK